METAMKKTDAKVKPVAELPGNGIEAEEPAGASVEKIRDILFGSQIKNYETRFARLEETVARESSDLKDTLKRRCDSLEGFFRKETEALAARIKSERDERTEALRTAAHDLKSASDTLGKKLQELDSKTAESQSELRRELMSESRKLVEEIRQRHDDLKALLEKRVAELRYEKVDRTVLASLLGDVALQLNDNGENVKAKKAKAGKES